MVDERLALCAAEALDVPDVIAKCNYRPFLNRLAAAIARRVAHVRSIVLRAVRRHIWQSPGRVGVVGGSDDGRRRPLGNYDLCLPARTS